MHLTSPRGCKDSGSSLQRSGVGLFVIDKKGYGIFGTIDTAQFASGPNSGTRRHLNRLEPLFRRDKIANVDMMGIEIVSGPARAFSNR